jgi:Ca-activated chloride channel homolog
MFKFANIEYFWFLALVPVLILVFLLMLRWKKNAIAAFGDNSVVQQLMPDMSPTRPKWKVTLQIIAFILLVIAMAAPQMGSKLEEVKREGVDIMLALDVSNSMLAEDLSPNRLERAKRAMLQMVDNLKGDRIGIVVFAGEAYVQLPITTDYGAAKMFLNTINTEIVPTQGTAIGTAIELCIRSFGENKENKKNRAIIVISDGEDHQDDPVAVAKEAANQGIVVHTVGMGSPQGAPIPVYKNAKHAGYKSDREGQTVVTRLDEATLQEIAAATGGMYIRATNAQGGLTAILDDINQMEKQEFTSSMFSDYEDQFQYFVALAMLLLALDFFLPERKSKWSGKLNLFGEKR